MERYSRQLLVSGIGAEGQKRLKNSRVLLVGCGGLGTNIANILVRAGVGFIRIIDKDFVELSNLQRQSLYNEKDVRDNLPKAVAACKGFADINSSVETEAVVEELHSGNMDKFIGDIDLIMDGTDNFATRFLINRISVANGLPWIYGGVVATNGVVMNFINRKGPCLECIYSRTLAERELPSTKTAGILGTLTSTVGAIQANEAIKYLTGNTDSLLEGMLYIDLWDNNFEIVKVSKKAGCDCCGQ